MTKKSDRGRRGGKTVPRPLRADSPSSEYARQVGLAIREAREAKGLTLVGASAQTGGLLSVQQWSLYEIGATEIKLRSLHVISDVLGIPLLDLVPAELRDPSRTGSYPPGLLATLLMRQGA